MNTQQRITQKFIAVIALVAVIFSVLEPTWALAQSGDGLKREYNAESGRVSFIGPESGRVLSEQKALGTFIRPQDPGMSLAKRFAPEFGIDDPERNLAKMKTSKPGDGRVTVRYQQTYQGVPVMGGELIVNTNERGDLYSMNGEVSPDLSLQTQPEIASDKAQAAALQAVAKWYQGTPDDFVATEPELWIYDESLLQPGTRPVELVWRMEVMPKDSNLPVRELVLVNAHRGGISLHFNQVDTAWAISSDIPSSQSATDTISTTLNGVSSKAGAETIQSSRDYMPKLLGATWYVATTGDDVDDCATTSTPCATINGAIGKAPAGDTIMVASGTYTGSGTQVVLVNKSVTLSGGWNASFTLQSGASTIDGQNSRQGIYVNNNSVTTSLDRFIITQGFSSSDNGGGINNYGNITISNSSIQYNSTSHRGGGIFNWGNLMLNNTTVSNNSASIYGGGIHNDFNKNLILNNTTIVNNHSGNYGGGIYFDTSYGNVSLQNSILDGNTATSYGKDCYGNFMSNGYNLIGNNSDCTFNSTTGDLVGTSTNPIGPRLTPLQDNGGPTLTHALMEGSPAIDAGNSATPGSGGNVCLVTDQRGVSRTSGSRCDIGAYEGSVPWVPTPYVWTYTANNTTNLPGTFLCNETQPNCTNGANPHADAAHKYAIGTYYLFANQHLRDSIDNNGMTIISTVHYDH